MAQPESDDEGERSYENQDLNNVILQSDAQHKWWLEQDAEAAKKSVQSKKEQAKTQLEQDRYLKALRALVSEKGSALATNEWRDGFFEQMETQMGCSNSQYYRNSKGYERALRDILHCINQFK